MTMNRDNEIKKLIIDAAFIRFCQYGFNKTTMAELAEDCSMSTGNIYRYFKSKLDIATELAGCHFNEVGLLLRDIVQRPGLTASQRLEKMILEQLHHSFECFNNQPKMSELVEFITKERKDLLKKNIEMIQSLIAEVLAQGNSSSEFNVDDIIATSKMIYIATIKFHAMPFMIHGFLTLEELKQLAVGVVKLIIEGLKKR